MRAELRLEPQVGTPLRPSWHGLEAASGSELEPPGTVPIPEFFSPENGQRIISATWHGSTIALLEGRRWCHQERSRGARSGRSFRGNARASKELFVIRKLLLPQT